MPLAQPIDCSMHVAFMHSHRPTLHKALITASEKMPLLAAAPMSAVG